MKRTVRKIFKALLIAAVILLLLVALIVIQQLRGATKEVTIEGVQKRQGKPVSVVHPRKRDFTDYLHADGEVQADRRAVLRSRLNEEVKKVFVESGDSVEKGQTLAKFRTEDLKAELKARKTVAKEAKRNYERYQSLYKAGNVTEQVTEQRRTALENAQARLRQIKSKMEFTTVEAPMAGRVERREVDPAEFKAAGNVLFTIVDLSTVVIKADVPGPQIAAFAPGDAAQFRLGGGGKWRTGSITRVRPATKNPNRFFEVFIEKENIRPNKNGGFLMYPGMYAEVRLPKEKATSMLAVPENTIRQTASGYAVYVVREHQEQVEVAKDEKQEPPQGFFSTVGWAVARYVTELTGGKKTEKEKQKKEEMREVQVQKVEAVDVEVESGLRSGSLAGVRGERLSTDARVVVNPTDELSAGQKVHIVSKEEEVDR